MAVPTPPIPRVTQATFFDYLQIEAPIDPSSLTRRRKRIGEEGVETLLMATIDVARRGGVMKAASAERVIVDTTVMPKAIAHPPTARFPPVAARHVVACRRIGGQEVVGKLL